LRKTGIKKQNGVKKGKNYLHTSFIYSIRAK